MILKKSVVTFIFLFFVSLSSVWANYNISHVNIDCGDTDVCRNFKKSFSRLVGAFENEDHFQAVLREYLTTLGYDQLTFSLTGPEQERTLNLHLIPKKFIQDVQVFLDGEKDETGLADLLVTKPDSFLQEENIQNDIQQLINKLSQFGFVNAKAKYVVEETKPGNVKVIFNMTVDGVNKINEIKYQCGSSYLIDLLKNNFEIYKNKTFVRDYIQQDINILKKLLIEQGYYQIELAFESKVSTQGISLQFDCKDEQLINVEFDDSLKLLEWETVYPEIRALLVKVDRQFIQKEIAQAMEKRYDLLGRKVLVKVTEVSDFKSGKGEKVTYKILITPSVRQRVQEILFRGNSSISRHELEKLYYENASDLSQSGYVDENYYSVFIDILKKKYYTMGYLTANVYFLLREEAKTNESRLAENENVRTSFPKKTLIFDINEGVKSIVSSFQIDGLQAFPEYQQLKITTFSVEVGQIFDPIKFEKSLIDFLQLIKERGHFDAHYIDSSQPTVTFERSAQQVHINVNIYLGPIYRVGNVHVVGLNKTKESVVLRKLKLKTGELLTSELIEKIQASIANLALFKNYEVKVLDYVNQNFYRDLVIHVQEKDFGVIEVAPGYRTDLGLRLAGKISYGNVWGLNHSVSLDVELNQRLSKSDLDPLRMNSVGSMLEYEVKANYNLPDLFKSYWDYNVSLSSARKRFYSFDADIERLTNTFSHAFTDIFSFSMRQQLEVISQYNSVQAINEGNFRIGSLTPALTIDKRNSSSYATKGYFLNLSYELAKPEFFSSNSNGYEIDFYRLVTRNRFYVPIRKNWGLALSLTVGIQENLRKEALVDAQGQQVYDGEGVALKKGFIPSIKVFRLSGIDTVRGFSEEEINRLPSGKDITSTLIQDKVYMTNIKIEPRYQWNDDIILGLFWDAGKVQVDNFQADDLRSAAGVSLKYLTPVGTLDFDYGMKLLRKRYADGTLESPGRIHISIGFF